MINQFDQKNKIKQPFLQKFVGRGGLDLIPFAINFASGHWTSLYSSHLWGTALSSCVIPTNKYPDWFLFA